MVIEFCSRNREMQFLKLIKKPGCGDTNRAFLPLTKQKGTSMVHEINYRITILWKR